MGGEKTLHRGFERIAESRADHAAVEDLEGRTITYGELAGLSDRLRDRLRRWDIGTGDRVGIYLKKSIDGVASMYGILKSGAAYVPVDPNAPPWRDAFVLGDCAVKAVIVEERFVGPLREEIQKLGTDLPRFLVLDGAGGGDPLRAALDEEDRSDRAPSVETVHPGPDGLAYILYTSGSTGKPKGVALSHRHAVSFVDWCGATFEPSGEDRFSSHAPFHFDLSIHDVHVSLKHGATLVLIDEGTGKDPSSLAPILQEKKISIWYSTPSILALLVQYGKIETLDHSRLRWVLFAGEVFPVKHLRALKEIWTHPRYANLYGPTETNVCTWYEIPREIPAERTEPYPIGKACSHCATRVVARDGRDVSRGEEGELCVSGSVVMEGYWNREEENDRVFFRDGAGVRWYRTGDVVMEEPGGDYVFVGRRDRMVKRRGYRVELGEIEAGLYRHPAIEEAAVVAAADEESGVRIRAFVNCPGERPSMIQLKRFCSENLPRYMIPDLFVFHGPLPRTSTDKVDYQSLEEIGT